MPKARSARQFFLSVIIIVFCFSAKAQSFVLARADAYFKDYAYKDAVELYEAALKKDTANINATRNISISYFKLNNYFQAEKWLSKLVRFKSASPDDYLNYAKVLETNGKIKEAEVWFGKYSLTTPADKRSARFIESIKNRNQYFLDSSLYKISIETINSSASDFSPSFYKEGIVFVSAENLNQFSISDKNYFTDLYFVSASKDFMFSEIKKFSNINSRYNEGPVSFNKDQNVMIFTRNNSAKGKIKRGKDGSNKLKLYSAILSNDEWVEKEEFSYNNDSYSCGHPALTADGKTLYFASDMPGGFGETDIYISHLIDGKWSKPENIGSSVNTEGKEMFPFVLKDSVLFFASDGLGGLGCLDIYSAGIKDNKILDVKNIGYPVNTSSDDFGLIYDTGKQLGFFSSNRQGGMGDDDIYRVNFLKKVENISAVADSGTATKKDVSVSASATENNQPATSVHGVIKYLATGKPISATVEIRDKKTNELVVIIKSDRITGEYNLNILTGKNYEMVVKTEDGSLQSEALELPEGNKIVKKDIFFSHSKDEGQATTAAGNQLTNQPINQSTNFNFLVFDYAKHDLLPESKLTLDTVVKFLKAQPTIKFDISGHTDSKGSDTYNMALSKRRANAVSNYLASKGINKTRIKTVGYGESKPIVSNENPDGTDNPAGRMQNRRVEVNVQNKDLPK